MLKENRKLLIITSLLILLPILVGLLLWDRLPDTVATHWGADGTPDGWGSKTFAVFAPPIFMLVTHWICVLVTFSDPKNKKRNKKVRTMVLWTIPFVSLFSSAMLYGVALNVQLNFASITFAMVGIVFAIIGNYLPKTSQNYTIGVKVPWALHDEENWNATHRFAGKLYVAGGLALVLLSFLATGATMVLMIVILLAMGLTPILYSWLYYKRQLKAGTVTSQMRKEEILSGKITKYAFLFVAVVFAIVGFILFTGNIDVQFGTDAFTIEASYWDDLEVAYSDIESIEYREVDNPGTRVWGYGSFRLLLGSFQNEEFGNYTRYSYYPPESAIVLTANGKTLVIGCADAETTHEIYTELTARLEG